MCLYRQNIEIAYNGLSSPQISTLSSKLVRLISYTVSIVSNLIANNYLTLLDLYLGSKNCRLMSQSCSSVHPFMCATISFPLLTLIVSVYVLRFNIIQMSRDLK